MPFRIGFGFDVHPFAEGRTLFLGGVSIPHDKGLEGHSDADVLIHAICDALLGAAALHDIGFYFPNSDPRYKNIDSKVLLKKVCDLIIEKKYHIGNIDATLCLEQPKVSSHIDKMRATLSNIMEIDEANISIKATTSEKLGFVGREEGVTAYAVVLLES